jgi:DNA-binding CsgD family transcriptional regulator
MSADVKHISSNVKNGRKYFDFRLIILVFFFFLAGLVIDGITYYHEKSWALLYINSIGIVLFAINIILKLTTKNIYMLLDIVSFLYITFNFIYTAHLAMLTGTDIDYELVRVALLCLLLLQTMSLLLPLAWVLVSITLLIAGYLYATFATSHEHLLENLVVIPFVFIGVTVWFRQYKQFIEKTIENEKNQNDENLRLAEIITKDKRIIDNYIKHLIKRSKAQGITIDSEVKELAKIVKYSLPSILADHTENNHSSENSFYRKLTKAHPTLTASELKLSFLLLKNLRSKEIAASTMRTTDSVRVMRYRLRNKLGLKKGMNMVSYLRRFE